MKTRRTLSRSRLSVLRVTADIQHLSMDGTKRRVTVEGTAEQIAMADWLVHQMDRPANGEFSGVHEYQPLAGSSDVVRVFYVNHAPTFQGLQEMVTTIRSVADIQRICISSALR